MIESEFFEFCNVFVQALEYYALSGVHFIPKFDLIKIVDDTRQTNRQTDRALIIIQITDIGVSLYHESKSGLAVWLNGHTIHIL